jgi:hypothetical protein
VRPIFVGLHSGLSSRQFSEDPYEAVEGRVLGSEELGSVVDSDSDAERSESKAENRL